MQDVLDDIQAKRNISQNVRFLLRERQWKQRELASATRETPMMISRICAAEHIPNAATLARIADALHTSVDWLLADHTNDGRQTA